MKFVSDISNYESSHHKEPCAKCGQEIPVDEAVCDLEFQYYDILMRYTLCDACAVLMESFIMFNTKHTIEEKRCKCI